MVMAAAYTLADCTPTGEGRVYPAIGELREISIRIAARVARQAITDGVCAERRIRNLTDTQIEAVIRDRAWQPRYLPLRRTR